MNLASLFNLAGPDLVMILLIVLLLFGAKKWPDLGRGMGEAMRQFMEVRRRWLDRRAESEGERESPVVVLNRLMVPIAIVIFLTACGVWFSGNDH